MNFELKSVVRSLWRAPGYSLAIVLMLGGGLGAVGALYPIIRDSLAYYRAYHDVGQLVQVAAKSPQSAFSIPVFVPRFQAYRNEAKSLAEIAGATVRSENLVRNGEPVSTQLIEVTPNYFSMLGVSAQLGRTFFPEEDEDGKSRVAVLADWFWKRQFGADPSIVGQEITLGENKFLVIGIMSKQFNPPLSMPGGGIYVPYRVPAVADPRTAFASLSVVGRLRERVTIEQAEAELRTIRPEVGQPYEKSMESFVAKVARLDAPSDFAMVRRYRNMQTTSAVAVGMLYLLATVNAGGLMLVRMLKRRRELAIRLSLGGTGWALFRLLAWEAGLLAGVSTIVGAVLATWVMPVLMATAISGAVGTGETVVDWEAIVALGAVAALSALVIAMGVAVSLSRRDLQSAMQEGGAGAGESRRTQWLRGGLVVVEVALAFTLLAGTGLMIRIFYQLQKVEPGYATENLFSARLDVMALRTLEAKVREQRLSEIVERVRTMPEVDSVAMTANLPSEYHSPSAWKLSGSAGAEEREVQAGGIPVSAGFFEAMRWPLRAGRSLAESRPTDSPVVMVNEVFAREYFGGANPVGQHFVVGKAQWEIIGVVGDGRSRRSAAKPMIYYPDWLRGNFSPLLVVWTRGAAAGDFGRRLAQAVYEVDPKLVLTQFEPVEMTLDREVSQERRAYALLRVMSGLALLMAGFGLAAMMVYTVAQRLREIGVRMALGATPAMIRSMIYRRGLVFVGLGTMVGFGLTWSLSRFLESLLYETPTFDPVTYAGTAGVIALAAVLACGLPAWRAAKVNLTQLLRAE